MTETNTRLFIEIDQAGRNKKLDALRTVSLSHAIDSRVRRLQDNSHSSPIEKLPLEILAWIFLLAIPKDDPDLWNALNWTRNSPNNVAAVCHFWRNVALSHGYLWSTFRFTNMSLVFDLLPWRLFRLFLRRSVEAPLDLKLVLLYTHANYSTITSLFHRYRARCRHIDVLWYRGGGKIKEVLEFPDMPILETLRLGLDCGRWPVRIDLSRSPCLQELEIRSLSSLETNGLTIPTLTSATLHPVSPYACLQFLKITPALVSFDTKVEPADRGKVEGPELDYVHNPSVTSFTLHWKLISSARSVLTPLHLPNLKKLVTEIGVDLHEDRPAAIDGSIGVAKLLSRSHALLEELSVNGCWADEIIECLRLSPNLKILSAYCYRMTPIDEDPAYEDGYSYINTPRLETVLLKGMKASNLRSVLKRLHLPKLRELSVAAQSGETSVYALGVAALLSRSHAPLTDLMLNACGPDEVLECLNFAPDLEILNVDFVRKFITVEESAYKDLCGPRLTTCSVRVEEAIDLRYFLKPLRFPSLTSLAILGLERCEDMGERVGASALLSRSKAPIKRLDLQNVRVEEVIECLELSPELEVLKVGVEYEDVPDVGHLIKRLTLTPDNWLCPKLKVIKFRNYSDMSKLVEELVAMINSRWYPVEGPRNLTTVNICEDDVTTLSIFDPYREEGLTICCQCVFFDPDDGPDCGNSHSDEDSDSESGEDPQF